MMEYTKLKNINEYISKSINPAKFPSTLFEMYSVPIFETGHPEYLLGSKIASNKTAVQKNDVLLCKINPRINRVWVVADESEHPNIASSEWIVVRSSKYNPEFLAWYFRSPKFKKLMVSEVAGIGGSLTRAQPKSVAEYPVPMLTLSEQDAIAAIFNRIDSIIKKRQQQLQKLDELVKARFVEMFGEPEINPFGWPVCTLKELVSIEPQNGLYKPQSAYVQDGSGFPIVRIDAFYNGNVTDFSTLKRLECSESEVQRYMLQEDDIVINRVNSIEYLGKCAHIKGLLEKTVFESNMMRFHLDDTVINAVFATKLLCSQYIYKQIMNRAKKAVNQASINQQDVLSFQMLVPPLELQKQFAAFVEQTDKSKIVVQKALDEVQLLFDSLMQQYFS